MMKSMAELPQRNELPAKVNRSPIIVSTLSSATSDIDSLRSHEVRAVSSDLRSRIKEQEEVLGTASKRELEMVTETEEMESQLRSVLEEAERFHLLYREEMKHKVENKTLIEQQKKDISRNFFITADLSRPNSRPGTRGTPKNPGLRRIDSAYGPRKLGDGSPTSGLVTKIVSTIQNPATLGGKRAWQG